MAEGRVSDDKQVLKGRHELPRRVVALIYVNLPEQNFRTVYCIQYMYTYMHTNILPFLKIPFSNKKQTRYTFLSYCFKNKALKNAASLKIFKMLHSLRVSKACVF